MNEADNQPKLVIQFAHSTDRVLICLLTCTRF